MEQIPYLPAVLLRHFTFSKPVSEQHEKLISVAEKEGKEYPIVGFGYSMKGEELILECLISIESIDVEVGAIQSLLEVVGKNVPKINVRKTGRIIPAARPAKGGDSLSLDSNPPTGTFGCLVKNEQNEKFILSCNHVMANLNSATRGTDVVWQPGYDDGGKSSDKIGTLSDFKDIQFGAISGNDIDAAICKPDDETDVESGLRKCGALKGIVSNPDFNIRVRKEGWMTGRTDGELHIKNLSVIVEYDGGQKALFDGQMAIIGSTAADFSKQGDSGSVIIDEDNKVIGLLFATASGIDLTYVNPIEAVLGHFGMKIVL